VRIAKPAPVAPPSVVFSGDEAALRAASLRTKGQEKPKDLSIPEDAPELESEKVERKPGQR
jgi:hypothetical protein